MVQLQVGSRRGSLVHRANDVRAVGKQNEKACEPGQPKNEGLLGACGICVPRPRMASYLPSLPSVHASPHYHAGPGHLQTAAHLPGNAEVQKGPLPFVVLAVKQPIEDLAQRADVMQVVQDDDERHVHGVVLTVALIGKVGQVLP